MDKKEIEFVKTLLDKLVNRIDELEEENNELKEKLVTTSDIIPCVSGSLQELCNWCKKVDFNDAQELIVRSPYNGTVIVDLNSKSSIEDFQEWINDR